jgi:hypothetical protein
VLGVHHRVPPLPHQPDEPLVLEAVVPRFQRVPERQAVQLRRQQVQERAKSSGSNFLVFANCHRIGPSLGP